MSPTGKRISLISKKNIRYEGVLYSINEQNATVALKNVRSFGTEGRELSEEGATFVAPSDDVHPFLLFRGQDIKDLHVHETATEPPPEDPAVVASGEAAAVAAAAGTHAPPAPAPTVSNENVQPKATEKPKPPQKKTAGPGRGNKGKGPAATNKNKPNAAVGTGASLLNRKARGEVDHGPEAVDDEFDFQSNLEHFKKEDEEEEEAGDVPDAGAYEKDDFFDSISCDALDKESGVDNRLRGSKERNLNTETFGAVALDQGRRRRYNGGRGGGRGRGRGGRGRGRGGRGGRGGSYRSDGGSQRQSNTSTVSAASN